MRQRLLGLGALLLVGSCCLYAYAANQTANRIQPYAALGITLQTVTWDEPDPGFAWEAMAPMEITYTWDWTPVTAWTTTGTPPNSKHNKASSADVDNGYHEISYVDTYAVTSAGQTSYSFSVELRCQIEDSDTGDVYECYASSTGASDAYNNLVDHTISASDWIIYQQ